MSSKSRGAGLCLRSLLAVYPATFRREFGDEILAFWLAQRHEPRYWRRGGGLVYWRDIARDTLRIGLRLRWRGNAPPSIKPASSRPGQNSRVESRDITLIGVLLHDLRYSVRFLCAAPLFSGVALVTLIVGIGTNTAIFGIVNGVLLRPLPYPDPDRLVVVWRTAPGNDTVSNALPDFHAYRERATTIEAVTATTEGTANVQWEDEARQHRVARVSADYFDVFRTHPRLGRAFEPSEDVEGGPLVAVISEALWRERFGGRPDVVGESITVSQQPHEIIGVLGNGPEHPIADIEIWLPLQDAQIMRDLGIDPNTRGLVYLDVYARLAEGSSIAEASDEVLRIMQRLNELEGREIDASGARAQSLHEATVGASRSALLLLLGAVGLLLAIVCANVAGLWLTRVAARTREIAIRTAIGAARGRVLRQLLTESMVLALVGGVGGVLLAKVLTGFMMTLAPETLPRHSAVVIDSNVLLYAGLVSAVCGIVFGLVPASRAAGLDPASTLRGSGRGSAGMAGRRLQRALVVAQVAVSVMLLAGAALLANSYLRLVSVDAGFEPDGVITAGVSAPLIDADTDRVRDFYARLLARVRNLPGVASASITYSAPLARNDFRQTVVAEGDTEEEGEDRIWVGTVIIGSDYFRTVGESLVRGRDFDESDRLGEPHVAIANEAMVARLWPGEDPLGKLFRTTGGISGSVDSFEGEFFSDDWITVVGVARNVRRRGLELEPVAEFYRPHEQMSWPSSTLVVKAERAPATLAEQIRTAVREVDSTVPMERVQTLGQLMSGSVAEPRFRLVLLGSFAGAACFLAMLGVYAVMTMTVSRHTHEIGLRMALGAGHGLVLRQVLLDGFRLTTLGLALGLAAALAGGRLLASMLFAITPGDPATLGAVALAVLVVALAACYLPARRAARLDPTQALRED